MTNEPEQITTFDVVLEMEVQSEEDAERAEFAGWMEASARTLWEIWDNEQDAIYNNF